MWIELKNHSINLNNVTYFKMEKRCDFFYLYFNFITSHSGYTGLWICFEDREQAIKCLSKVKNHINATQIN